VAGLLITTEAMVAEKPEPKPAMPPMPPGCGMDFRGPRLFADQSRPRRETSGGRQHSALVTALLAAAGMADPGTTRRGILQRVLRPPASKPPVTFASGPTRQSAQSRNERRVSIFSGFSATIDANLHGG
jgi:hypothetical protein